MYILPGRCMIQPALPASEGRHSGVPTRRADLELGVGGLTVLYYTIPYHTILYYTILYELYYTTILYLTPGESKGSEGERALLILLLVVLLLLLLLCLLLVVVVVVVVVVYC